VLLFSAVAHAFFLSSRAVLLQNSKNEFIRQLRRLRNGALTGFLAGGVLVGCSTDISVPAARNEPQAVSMPNSPRASLPPVSLHAAPVPVSVEPQFVDIAADAQIRFSFFSDMVPERFYYQEVMGGGAAWLDFDGDGRLDLYVRDGCRLENPESTAVNQVSRLFRNSGAGTFVDVTASSGSGVRGYGQGAAPGDFDADGFPDLYLTNYGPSILIRNHGDGTFEDVTLAAQVGAEEWGTSAAWFDADGDGQLDLYVANYLHLPLSDNRVCEYNQKRGYCGPGQFPAARDRLYLNQGNGSFVESAEERGLLDPDGKGLGVLVADFDDDLLPEIMVANDMTPNHLFTRSTTFESGDAPRRLYANVASSAGCALSDVGQLEAGMGIACADFDGDGRPDLFMTHYYHMKNTLYRNRGGLIFDDDSYRTRIAATSFESLGFGTWPIDYDRDGDADLFVANGHVLGPNNPPFAMRPQLLLNTACVFSDISERAGAYFQAACLGRGVAAADFDNDGDLDIVVTHLDRPLALLRNDTQTKRRYIGLELSTSMRIPPIGGRVVVTCGQLRQVLPVVAGGSYLSASDSRLQVGLGDESATVDVEIHWPSGRVDEFGGLDSNCYWHVSEGRRPERLPPR